MEQNKPVSLRERLHRIREPQPVSAKGTVLTAALMLLLGGALGCFSKWLDSLALDATIWWHRILAAGDLGIFFSDLAIWLLLALLAAVFSRCAWQAALHVFLFFAGMCAAYHLYTVLLCGFNPDSYMLIWYGITLLSPLLAVACWYAKGKGLAALLLSTGIMAVFTLSCFSVGLIYISFRGILYLLVFAGAAAALYNNPKQSAISVPAGFLLAFLLSPLYPFK